MKKNTKKRKKNTRYLNTHTELLNMICAKQIEEMKIMD